VGLGGRGCGRSGRRWLEVYGVSKPFLQCFTMLYKEGISETNGHGIRFAIKLRPADSLFFESKISDELGLTFPFHDEIRILLRMNDVATTTSSRITVSRFRNLSREATRSLRLFINFPWSCNVPLLNNYACL
jgi:hypothetical protein